MPAAYTMEIHCRAITTCLTPPLRTILRLMGQLYLWLYWPSPSIHVFYHIVHALAVYFLSGLFAAYRLVETSFADVIVK